MKWFLLIHVLSAVIGIGPTFFAHYITRNGQTVEEFKHNYKIGKKLYIFPLIGGPIAVITGIIITHLGNYNFFSSFWLYGSLIIYIIIQVIGIGVLFPSIEKVAKWVMKVENKDRQTFPAEQERQIRQINRTLNVVSVLSIMLFTLMVIKPIFT